MAFTRNELELVRAEHVSRIARTRKVDARHGGPIGLPFRLVSLGAFLADQGVAMPQSDGERWHGWDRSRYLDLLEPRDNGSRATLVEGEEFARQILNTTERRSVRGLRKAA